MDQWLERLGFAGQWLVETARAAAHAATDAANHLAEQAADAAEDPMEQLPAGVSPAFLAGAAGTMLAARLLQPSEVRWSRAVLAGVVGTLLYDAEMVLDQRLSGRKFDTIGPLGEALTDSPELQPWAGWAAHYAAGVVLAMCYARYLHDRIPGPPALRGALFGVVDAVTLEWGGLLPLLSRVVPGARVPPGYVGLAHCPGLTAQSLLRHTAYGIGVGLVYRSPEQAPFSDGLARSIDW